MKKEPVQVAALRKQALALEKQNAKLRKSSSVRDTILNNTLSSFVSGAITQDNITSFNPIIQASIYAPLSVNWNILMYMYKTHGIVQTAIDEPVRDAFRGGLEIKSDELKAPDIGELEDFMEENGILETVKNAIIWGRLFGGAALIINAESDPMTPLDHKHVKGGRVEFYDATRWELGCKWRYDDFYQFYEQKLDKSRVLTIGNKRAPWIIRQQLAGWDMSEVERMVEDFNLYLRTRNVLYELLDEAKVDVYSLQGFREQLTSSVGTQKTQVRIALMNQLKNFQNAIILDKEDEYEQKQMTFTGISEIMKENRMGLASALRMPITKLFGVSATGFNSGEDDIENYNAMIESQIREPNKPLVRKVLNLCMLSVFGRVYDFSFNYKPLRVMSSKEEEEINTSKQNRYDGAYDRGLLDSAEWGDIMHKEKLIPIETKAQQGKLDPHPNLGMDYTVGDDEDDDQGDDKDERGKAGKPKPKA